MNMSQTTNRRYKVFILLIFSSCLISITTNSQAIDNTRLRVITGIGSFTIELYRNKAPKSVANILQHVDAGFYNGAIFHRTVKNFIVQTGAYNQEMTLLQPLNSSVEFEANNGLKNLRGSVAVAHNAGTQSALSQFFINIKSNPHLDYRANTKTDLSYTVIGKVISGMNIVRRMSRVSTDDKDLPLTPIVIKRISRI
jgi:cyclophilin family peptidyl-prolyl cis-trans isomerase